MERTEFNYALPEFRWPEKKDRPFAGGNDRYLQAFPNWTPEHMRQNQLAEGCWSSANELIRSLESQHLNRHPDMYFRPIAILFRQFLELSMKSVIEGGVALGILKDQKIADYYGHNLHRLWEDTRKVIEELNGNASDKTPVLAVERIVRDFHRMDKTGQEFRYSFKRDGTPTLKNAPDAICLSNLREVMDGVHSFFDGIGAQVSEAVHWHSESHSYDAGGYY